MKSQIHIALLSALLLRSRFSLTPGDPPVTIPNNFLPSWLLKTPKSKEPAKTKNNATHNLT